MLQLHRWLDAFIDYVPLCQYEEVNFCILDLKRNSHSNDALTTGAPSTSAGRATTARLQANWTRRRDSEQSVRLPCHSRGVWRRSRRCMALGSKGTISSSRPPCKSLASVTRIASMLLYCLRTAMEIFGALTRMPAFASIRRVPQHLTVFIGMPIVTAYRSKFHTRHDDLLAPWTVVLAWMPIYSLKVLWKCLRVLCGSQVAYHVRP